MSHDSIAVNPWMMLPFGILLILIALGPVLFEKWWGKHYPKVACGLAVVTLTYYFFGLHASGEVWHTAHEYISFIALIGSLFIVAGGIHINVKGEGTPFVNVVDIAEQMTINAPGVTYYPILWIQAAGTTSNPPLNP